MTTELTAQSFPEERKPELTPEEAALVARLGVFVAMRWLAIASIILATLLATQVFHINFSPLPLYIICACMVLYNFVLFLQERILKAEASGTALKNWAVPWARLLKAPDRKRGKAASSLVERARAVGNIHIILDLVALIVLLHFTGGIENPFIFYFIFHVIIAGILLRYQAVYVLATSAILLVILLVGLEYIGVIPHVHLDGFASPTLYRQETYILVVLVVLTTCLYGSAYMVSAISGELRKRQREVVALREHRLIEKVKELKEVSKELAKLEEGRKHLLRFLAMASHDLKAPLSAIQSYFGVMLGGFAGEMTEKQKRMMERSSQRITELLNLISDLLDISRIEAGQIVQEMEEMSLSRVVGDSVENVHSLAKERRIGLKVEVPKSLPQLQASGKRLQQIITNLLINAIKFTPEKGAVKLRVTDRENDIQVEVMDSGNGITAEELPKIFDDFYRGKDDTEKAGTGLGLSIAKRIVEAHGGQIWAESPNPEDELARGSKFTFTLPKNLVPVGEKRGKQNLVRGRKR